MEISLGSFIRFANASERARPRLARQIAAQANSEYNPATDFWRPMRQAIHRDRKTSRDGEALRAVALAAPSFRRTHFEQISNKWRDVSPRWREAAAARVATDHVDVGGLTVRLRPLFAEEWGDGHGEAAHVWFNKAELLPETLDGVRALLASVEGDSDLEAVFVDMRRGAIVPAGASADANYTQWLDDLGHEYVRLMDD